MLPILITLAKGAITVAPAVETILRQRRAQQARDDAGELELDRDVLLQIWQAHQFQARQRNVSFGAFVAGLAVLAMAYAVAIVGDVPGLAALLAVAGCVAAVFLNRLDSVHRSRVREIERAFSEVNQRLVLAGDPTREGLVPRSGNLSQDILSLLLQAFAFWAFVAAFFFGAFEAL